ncbi:hypothetical protein PHET_03239 [Paragonimus heterotremus]|uniref:Cilia- and flagella-associated protein 263 n=1 Tax=Paragonimus heterotremus TaxID=100268 RepID=A0A8J4TIN4_9TREM|nr:hypothetical protein PHET_03239 [Paragonimus heterotremus]
MLDSLTNEEWIFSLEDEEIQKLIKETKVTTALDTSENDIFKRFLAKVDMNFDAKPIESNLEQVGKPLTTRRKSKSRTSSSDRSLKLTLEQKCHVAQIESDAYKQEIAATERQANKVLDDYRAKIEELNIRFEENKRSVVDFRKIVVKEGYNDWIKSVCSEKFVRFSEETLCQRDTTIDKLRLKNNALNGQLKKLRGHLRQKEELGDVLHAVDFEQLKIDNTKCLAQIDDKNRVIQKLKLAAGRTQQVLNSLKEHAHENLINKNFYEQKSSYTVPSVLDFVRMKNEEREMARQESIYNRRLKIAEMALARHKKVWTQTLHGGAMGKV